MQIIDLEKHENNVKIGDVCGDIQPNILEDSIFKLNGERIKVNNYKEFTRYFNENFEIIDNNDYFIEICMPHS